MDLEANFLDNISNGLNLLKKHKISVVSVLVFVLALSCVFAFAGKEDKANDDSSAVAVVSESALPLESAEETVSESELEVVQGYAVYLDNYLLCAVTDKAIAENAFEKALSERASSLELDASAQHSFTNKVEYVEGEFNKEFFVDENAFVSLVVSDVVNYVGELLPVNMSITSVLTTLEEIVIEHNTKVVYTDALANGSEKTLTKGFDGEGKRTNVITYLDGVQTNVSSSVEVTKEAVDEVLQIGTRAGSYTVASSIDFEWPYDGFIYSYYGETEERVQTHKGIDLVNYGGCYRDPAYAAADGVVIFSGDKGNGYGNYVILDHGNGIITIYAHFDSCSVSTGDVVKAGDEVGRIGSTGRSTGNHLHFEILINDVSVDPLLYLD